MTPNRSEENDSLRPMRFNKYYFSKSIADREITRRRLQRIDPLIEETKLPTLHCLVISSPEETAALWNSETYVVTPQYIKDCLDFEFTEIPLEPNSRQALSLCLSGITVTPTGFLNDVEIAKMVILLSGHFSKFCESTSVVLAKTAASNTVVQARQNQIPVVKFEWLELCFTKLRRFPPIEYQLLPFTGCTFTSSDLTPEQQKQMKQKVEQNGGKFQTVLNNETTFLISSHLVRTKKIELALRDSIPIVKPDWITHNDQNLDDFVLNWWCMSDRKSSLFADRKFSIGSNLDFLVEIIETHSGIIAEDGVKIGDLESNLTPDWILNCVENKKIVSTHSPLFQPLKRIEIEGLSGKQFVLFRLNEETRFLISSLIRSIGGYFSYRFIKDASFVITEKGEKKLMDMCLKHSIPIVKPGFILESTKLGRIADISPFLIENLGANEKLQKICALLKGAVKTRPSKHNIINIPQSELEKFDQKMSPDLEANADVTYESRLFAYEDTETLTDQLLEALSQSQPI